MDGMPSGDYRSFLIAVMARPSMMKAAPFPLSLTLLRSLLSYARKREEEPVWRMDRERDETVQIGVRGRGKKRP